VEQRKILIAEDDAYGLMLISDVLAHSDFAVISAPDGLEALRLVRAEKPDIVLMDIRMPKLSGLEVIRTMKADAELRHIPVIALTVCVMKEEQRAVREAGADAFVPKPCSMKELLTTIDSLLNAEDDADAARGAAADEAS